MASLYVTEFSNMGETVRGAPPIALTPIVARQKKTIGSETKTSAFNAATKFIRVHADAICSIAIGDSLTADTTDLRMAANATEYFAVVPGHTLSVISNT